MLRFRGRSHPLAVILMALLALSPIASKAETQPAGKMAQGTKAVLEHHFSADRPEIERTIPSQEIIDAIRAGKAVDIENAVIRGPFILQSVSVEKDISIKKTKITDRVDWSYANFKGRVTLEGDIFEKEAVFQGATFERDVDLDGTFFKGLASFTSVRIEKDAAFNGATFGKPAEFFNIRIGDSVDFNKAIFKDRLSFDGAQIMGAASFQEARFGGAAYFVGARFEGGAFFTGAQFQNLADFHTSEFIEETHWKGTYFGGDTHFTNARIEQGASFNKATFKKKAMFFNIGLGSDINFNGAVFQDSTSFDGAQIKGAAFFVKDTEADKEVHFEKAAYFVGARFEGGAFFDGARFADLVSFQDASFGRISFGSSEAGASEAQFQQTQEIDLRGSVYSSIVGPDFFWAKLRSLKNRLLDSQFFHKLETTFREAGKEDLAKQVYFERRLWEAEPLRFQEQPLVWIGDRLLRLLTGYGVQLWRLLVFIILVLALGTYIFHREGAVEAKSRLHLRGSEAEPTATASLPWLDAFWMSLRLFLPVEIPAGADWQPSSKTIVGIRCTSWASVLKVIGWILVPLGVAGITGLLVH